MKKTQLFSGLICLAFLIFSCEKEKPNVAPKSTEVSSFTIAKGCLYGASSEGFVEENRIITDSIAWNDLKAQMDQANEVSYQFAEQEIDFSQWTVLVSIDQVQPNGGHAIDYSSIVESDASIIATIYKEYPQGNATTVITQPFIIVKIPKTSKTIYFN